MFYLFAGADGDFCGVRETEEEAIAWVEDHEDAWYCSEDEDCKPDNIDDDFGFDPYMGEYTYDC